jgi:hypothetical protein
LRSSLPLLFHCRSRRLRKAAAVRAAALAAEPELEVAALERPAVAVRAEALAADRPVDQPVETTPPQTPRTLPPRNRAT